MENEQTNEPTSTHKKHTHKHTCAISPLEVRPLKKSTRSAMSASGLPASRRRNASAAAASRWVCCPLAVSCGCGASSRRGLPERILRQEGAPQRQGLGSPKDCVFGGEKVVG